jgi:hypothetical protein
MDQKQIVNVNINDKFINDNPIRNLKIFTHSTHLKDFPTNEFNISILPEKNNFKITFRKINEFIQNFEPLFTQHLSIHLEKIQSLNTYEEKATLADELVYDIIKENLSKIEEEILTLYEQEWNCLNSYFSGRTKIHIILTLIFLHIDLNYENNNKHISEYDKNILHWALLFHDIAKHVNLNKNFDENFPEKSKW